MIGSGIVRPCAGWRRIAVTVGVMVLMLLLPVLAAAAPFSGIVMDARTGKVLWQENADTRLHPASLTKMLTLYIAFDAIRRGEVGLDDMVTVSAHAAAQPPSRLGLKKGQRISLRHLIRAAAIKSANDAASAIGDHISGSEAAFAQRMNRTATALGMTRSTFRNAHGLTAAGHLSTARDMTLLGRRLFYDFPQYYGLFSRITEDAGVARVANTNRRFLQDYRGADGIKTGYTNAAGFNLTASAERGNKRLVATVMGGASTAHRNQRMAELLDIGFGKAPARAPVTPPPAVVLAEMPSAGGAGKTIRLRTAVARSPRPPARPVLVAPAPEMLAEVTSGVTDVLAALDEPAADIAPTTTTSATAPVEAVAEIVEAVTAPPVSPTAPPPPRPAELLAADSMPAEDVVPADVVAAAVAAVVAPEVVAPEVVADNDAAPVVAVADAAETTTAADIPFEVVATVAAENQPTAATDAAPAREPELAALEPSLDEVGQGTVAADQTVPEVAAPGAITLAATDATTDLPVPPEDDGATMPELQRDDSPLIVPQLADAVPTLRPRARPGEIVMTVAAVMPAPPARIDNITPVAAHRAAGEVVTRISTSGGRHWGVTLGRFGDRGSAERALLQTALAESRILGDSLRKVVKRNGGWEATFAGLARDEADLACRRLQARAIGCFTLGP